MAERTGLPRPAVSPDVYDDEYYRRGCMGAEEWSASGGREPHGVYRGILQMAGFRPGMVVVDVGCGRGELVALAARDGAARAIGVDYASSAIELARETLRVHDVTDTAEVHLVDARQGPVADGVADLVTLVDVVEHLTPDELRVTLQECRRMLRPGGRVFVHTMPNRLVYQVTWPLLRLGARLKGHRWPADPRSDYERAMHVNEQTLGSLRRSLRRSGLVDVDTWLGQWVHTAHLPGGRGAGVVARLARTPGLRRLGRADLFGVGTVPAPGRAT